jgi:hypothetical protein
MPALEASKIDRSLKNNEVFDILGSSDGPIYIIIIRS